MTVIPWGDGVMKPLVSQVPVTPGLKVPIHPYTRDELGKRIGEGTRLGATLTQVAEAGYACHVIVVLTDEYPNDISLLNRALGEVLKTNAVGIFLLSKMYHGKEHNGFSFSVFKDVRPESDKYAIRYWHTKTILQVLPQFIEALPGCQFIS